MSQHDLEQPPDDAISSTHFSHSGDKLAVSSWNRTVSIYNRSEGAAQSFTLSKRLECRAPILDIAWSSDDDAIFGVGLDQDVRRVNIESEDQDVLSTHEAASNKVVLSREHNILLSTSWDSVLHVHNLAVGDGKNFIAIRLAAKPFAISLTSTRCVVAMAERKLSVYDLRALHALTEQTQTMKSSPEEQSEVLEVTPWQSRESSLKFMTRAISCMPDGSGFATSSIEGRVGVDWFDPSSQDKTYAFKCHRQTSQVEEDGETKEVDIVYPVNALAFHPVHGTFATGGGDGVVAIWDAQTKRRIRQYQKLGASVAAIDFTEDGKFMAIGISPGFEDGSEEQEMDPSQVKVIVRELSENEAKGKAAK